jgi:hypothetical protein
MKRFALSLMITGIVSFFSSGILALPEDGLVLHFAFDGGSVDGDTVKDLSGNGNDATINGGVKATNEGLEFDGADGYVGTAALDIRTAGNNTFAALCWFKTDEVPNGPLWMWGDNANPSSSSDAEAPMGWRQSTGNFAAGFYSGGHFYADAQETYADGQWHFAAQVGDGVTGYLYVDGEQISSTTAGYIYSASPYFLIGARTKNSGSDIDDVEYFKGVIGQVALYNVALGGDDLKAIAVEAMAVSPSGKLTIAWGQIRK